MRTSEILRAARALIDTPEKLEQSGIWYCTARSSYCSLAAIAVVTTGQYPCSAQVMDPANFAAVTALARAAGVEAQSNDATMGATFRWSDCHAHAEVLAAFDTAIADAEAAEQEFACEPVTIPDRVAA